MTRLPVFIGCGLVVIELSLECTNSRMKTVIAIIRPTGKKILFQITKSTFNEWLAGAKNHSHANAKKAVMLLLKPIGFPAVSEQICGRDLNRL